MGVFPIFATTLYESPKLKEIFQKRGDFANTYSKNKKLFNECNLKELVKDFRLILSNTFLINPNIIGCISEREDKFVFMFAKDEFNLLSQALDYVDSLLKMHDEIWRNEQVLTSFIDCHLALLLFASNLVFEINYSPKAVQVIKEELKTNIYYRGHSNSSYALIPSVYRGLKIGDSILKKEDLESFYEKCNLIKKYNEISTKKIRHINYSFLAYAQHSCAYSPFLDFSKDIDVAKVFSTHDTNYNAFRFNDSALFVFQPDKNEKRPVDDCLKDFEISFHQGKLTYSSYVFGNPVWLCTLKDFFPRYTICDAKTNDRMKYQKWSFLFIYRCVIANGHVCVTHGTGLLLKLTIPCEQKNQIYDEVIKLKPHFEYRYLLDPYLYLSECNKKG